MKRCPECYEIYQNSERFCELDGKPLLFDPALSVDVEESATVLPNRFYLARESWASGIIGAISGIVVCLGVLAGYALWTLQSDSQQEASSTVSQALEPVRSVRATPARVSEPAPRSAESPSPEAEASPEPSPNLPVVSENQVALARLNRGPISTGQRNEGGEVRRLQTIIQMNDGSTVEVDAAWEDSEGVWYRRGGLVSFVDTSRVKAITTREEPKPSPSPSQ